VTIEPGTSNPLFTGIGGSIALSPDGRTLALVAVEKGLRWLFVRRLDELQATRLPGTEDAISPFFSPDGQSIGFFTTNHLKRVAVSGGAATTVATAAAEGGRGGAWSEDGTIVFQASTAPFAKLMRVAETGGTPAPLVAQGVNDGAQRWPQVLPGGRAVLYGVNLSPTGWDNASVVVQPLPGGAPRTLVEGGYHPRYVASGHVLYLQRGTLFAVPFDVDRLELTGAPVALIEGVAANTVTGGAHYAVANTGTLAYIPGTGTGDSATLSLFDTSGTVTNLVPTPLEWLNPRFSPTGDRIALVITNGDASDVHVYDITRRRLDKITFEAGTKAAPVWAPNGERIVYTVIAPGVPGKLYSRRADGTGDVQQLTTGPHAQTAYSFDPSGKYLAITERDPSGTPDILIMPLDGDERSGWKAGTPRPFVKTPETETYAMFSPDGRWIAYMSAASGRSEIYVRPFNGSGGPWQITMGGGIFPTWSKSRDEILYVPLDAPGTLMATSFSVVGDAFRAGSSRAWSTTSIRSQRPGRTFDLHPDGNRVVSGVPDTESDREERGVVLVFNFFEKLRQLKGGVR
jgi:serine/threonine-protein kinase